MLELFASDTTELAGVYDALAGRGGPLQDRAFVQEQVVAAAGREQAGTASYDPFAGNDGAQAFGRGWAQICAQPRNIAFVLLGAAVAFAALYVEASTFTEDSSGATSTCSWDPDRGTLDASLAGPVVGSALVF